MRQRHAAKVQRPHGQIPKATRPDTDGHTAESPRTRSRIHSPTLSGPSATDGPPRPGNNPTRQLCDHDAPVPLPDRRIVLITLVGVRSCYSLNPAGGPTEPTGPDNIHVTKSPGTLLPRTARRIQKGEVPAAPVHDHGPAEHSHPQISTEAVSTQPGDTFKRPNPRGPCP